MGSTEGGPIVHASWANGTIILDRLQAMAQPKITTSFSCLVETEVVSWKIGYWVLSKTSPFSDSNLCHGVLCVFLSPCPFLFLFKEEQQPKQCERSALFFALGLSHKHKQLVLFKPQHVPAIPNSETSQCHRHGSPKSQARWKSQEGYFRFTFLLRLQQIPIHFLNEFSLLQ